MRRTLISVKGFTAPRSSTSTIAITAAEPTTNRTDTPRSREASKRRPSAHQSHSATPRLSTSARGETLSALPAEGPSKSTKGKSRSRKRARTSVIDPAAHPASLLDDTGSVPSSLSTNLGGVSQSSEGRPAKDKRKKVARHERRADTPGHTEAEAEDEADDVAARSRRLHNGDVIALAPPPPKNLAQPGAPRGLHHPSGQGARRQVVYPDPVIPSTAWLAASDAGTGLAQGLSTVAPSAGLVQTAVLPFALVDPLPAPMASEEALSAHRGGQLMPVAWAASVEAMRADTPPHLHDGTYEADDFQPRLTDSEYAPLTPARAAVRTMPDSPQAMAKTAVMADGSPEAMAPSMSSASADGTPVRSGFALASVMVSQPLVGSVPSLDEAHPSAHASPRPVRLASAVVSSRTSTDTTSEKTTSSSSAQPGAFLRAMMDFSDTPPVPHSAGSDGTTRVLLWEPAIAAASASAHTASRRTMISLTKPTLPSSADVSVIASSTDCAPIITAVEEEEAVGGVTDSAPALLPEPALLTARDASAESAELFDDNEEACEAVMSGAADGEATSGHLPATTAEADVEAAENARNDALDREVEEDMRLSEDLPFTPSGFYASSPFAAQRLTQEDENAGGADGGATVADAFQDALLAKMDVAVDVGQVRAMPEAPPPAVPFSPSSSLPRAAEPLAAPAEPSPQRTSIARDSGDEDALADPPRLFDAAALLVSAAVLSGAGGGAALRATSTRTLFRFSPAVGAGPVPPAAEPVELPRCVNEEAAEPADEDDKKTAMSVEKEALPTSSDTTTHTVAGLTPETPHVPASAHNDALSSSTRLVPCEVPSDAPSRPLPTASSRTMGEGVAPHASPLRPAGGGSGTEDLPPSSSTPRSAPRPKRTLFHFGLAPPVVDATSNATTAASPSRTPPAPEDARIAVSALTASVTPARHTPSPAGPASMTAATTMTMATSAAVRAEPTEMFMEDGDSVSVPVPPPLPDDDALPPPAEAACRAHEVSPALHDPYYGLPPEAFRLFLRQRCIQTFYAWQHEVLTSAELLRGRNYVYSLPTSGGKTLVAEISILRCLLGRQLSCFFVLPFVSLAEEKTAALQPLGDAFGFRVEGHYGFTGRFPLPAGPTVYVCTIEKANSVLSYLLEERRAVPELGLVVVDELHMLGESRRGATLEVFLSKLLLLHARQEEAARAQPPPQPPIAPALVQIVGMSATVPNLPIIARWLDAACYEGTYRPVPLHQYSVVDGMVLRDGQHNERNLSGRNEVEQLLELATELPDCSVLVFCASRQQCVDTAKGIVRYLQHTTMTRTAAGALPASDTTTPAHGAASPPLLQPLPPSLPSAAFSSASSTSPLSRAVALGAQPPHTAAALQALLNELLSLSYGQADQLADLVPYGVAYHHGGLLAEERELIESAYRDRHLRILCCTSTLAAGVNLPARRVIFKSPYTGREFLTKSRYLQMCGRAGRAGLDTYGESFLLLNRRDRQRGLRLMLQPLEPCESQLLEEHSQFVRALLECISVGLVPTRPHGLEAWGRALFCGHALGALDVVTTAELWRTHRSLWQPALPDALVRLTATEEEAAAGGAVAGSAAPVASTAITGIHLALPGVVPALKTALSVAEVRSLRAAFASDPAPLLHTLLEAAVTELLTHGFIALTEVDSSSIRALTTATAAAAVAADPLLSPSLPPLPPLQQQLSPTPFGVSSVRSCFSVESALLVRKELDEMLHMGLILADDLHLCYFLTPLREVPEQCDWALYRSVLARLSDSRQRIASLIGLDEFYIDQRAMGLAGPTSHAATTEEGRRQSFTARRFWVALILADVLAEVPMPDVVARYGVNRGMLQDVMRSASMFSSSITSFCHAMGWYSLEAVLASFVKRLGFGVKPDIVPLMDIRGVQPSRARALWNAGYKDPARVAAGDPDEMVTRVKESNPPDSKSAKFFTKRSALMVIREASLLIENQIREKRGELRELTARTAV